MDTARYSTCLTLPVTIARMNGDEIRTARERRGWTQAQLATAVGVGQRTIGNWERGETVPKNRAGMLADVLGLNDTTNPLAELSDLELLGELTRRAVARTHQAAVR
jgi:transcriptional regulator with XRE-family HTH domain